MDHGTDREPKKQRNEDHERETNSALTRTVRKECSWGFAAVTLICSLRASSNIIPSRFHHLRVNYRGGIYTEQDRNEIRGKQRRRLLLVLCTLEQWPNARARPG